MAQPVSPGQLSLLDFSPESPADPLRADPQLIPPGPEAFSPAVAGAVSAGRSDATRKAYSGQWRQFVA